MCGSNQLNGRRFDFRYAVLELELDMQASTLFSPTGRIHVHKHLRGSFQGNRLGEGRGAKGLSKGRECGRPCCRYGVSGREMFTTRSIVSMIENAVQTTLTRNR